MQNILFPTSQKTSRSAELFERARKLIPGGVNSPVRAFRAVGSSPVFLVRGRGSNVVDADGKHYLDYVGAWGPLLLGHAHPDVERAVGQALERGTAFGFATEAEVRLAELINEIVPSVEKVRLVTSGTEATMSAVRLARGFTERKKIIKFIGGYHGHVDSLLVKAGSGVATFSLPDSAGVPKEFTDLTLALPYNDVAAAERVFVEHAGQIAAVIVEPVAGNMGCVPPSQGFLPALRELTQRDGSLLIFDEVMTGFRVSRGGAQELYGIKPDLTTLGKIIGGGLPIGAYGGRADIMDMVAPEGPVYQAGTLAGNPLAVAAGIAMLEELRRRPLLYSEIEARSQRLADGLQELAVDARIPTFVNRVGSMLTLFFTPGPVVDWSSAERADRDRFAKFFHLMLERNILLPPSQFEAWFVSAAHTDKDVDITLAAAEEACNALAQELS
ncbi:MAG: glutamate-1-semialdehyde-2,1-aminomutase [Acidobacteria bacterium]|nr:glutamate-1-semialdehyde-2,1-aminomutase [Acidobacteriota bacterium]